MLDYMMLKQIWWALFGFLVAAYAVTGGMDIGVNILLPVIGRTDDERRLILNATGPTWEGNQVWLIVLGAGLFAIWPIAYGTIFSSMYLAFLLVLLMLILRPPGLDYRSKLDSKVWRQTWDTALFTSNFVLALAFGLVIGNLFTGLPFQFDSTMREFYSGSFVTYFSPCALIFAVANFCMMGLQGALYLQYKLPAELEYRAKIMVKIFGIGFLGAAIVAGLYVCLWIPGYKIVEIPDLNTNIIVTQKVVITVLSGWAQNYANHKVLCIVPIMALVMIRVAMRLSQKDRSATAIFVNSLGIVLAASAAGIALYPFIMPSSSLPNHSLTIWDVCSSELTLKWSLFVTLLLVPVILLYTTWVYRVMRGKVSLKAESY